jgi:hypothetical protein
MVLCCAVLCCAGDEVVDPATAQLGPGQIRDCNRAMLLAAVASAGAEAVDLGIARDVEGHLEGAVDKAIAVGADVLVTTGGCASDPAHMCWGQQVGVRLIIKRACSVLRKTNLTWKASATWQADK